MAIIIMDLLLPTRIIASVQGHAVLLQASYELSVRDQIDRRQPLPESTSVP